MLNEFDQQIRLKVLKMLKDSPAMSQREMHKKMGVSLGKVNYCISKLTEQSMIRVKRFKNAEKKAAYSYHLTPTGLDELATLTVNFLKKRIKEYDEIKLEIKELSEQVHEMNPDLSKNFNLNAVFEK